LPAFGCLVAAWASHPPDSFERWALCVASAIPYPCLAGFVWRFRRDARGSFALLLTAVLVVGLGIWAWWPDVPTDGDKVIGKWMSAIIATGFQLMLCSAGIIWAGVWTEPAQRKT